MEDDSLEQGSNVVWRAEEPIIFHNAVFFADVFMCPLSNVNMLPHTYDKTMFYTHRLPVFGLLEACIRAWKELSKIVNK